MFRLRVFKLDEQLDLLHIQHILQRFFISCTTLCTINQRSFPPISFHSNSPVNRSSALVTEFCIIFHFSSALPAIGHCQASKKFVLVGSRIKVIPQPFLFLFRISSFTFSQKGTSTRCLPAPRTPVIVFCCCGFLQVHFNDVC